MKVNRKELVNALDFAMLGVSARGETLEQSDSFVFEEGRLVTFNDEIKTSAKSPLGDITVSVIAADFLKLLAKMPDEELDIKVLNTKVGNTSRGSEVHIIGKRRKAGVSCFEDIALPHDAVPKADKWKKVTDGVMGMIQHAANVCGRDITQELTLMVHVTPDIVEACDNYRLLRADIKTGFPNECLLPAASIGALNELDIRKVSLGEGWAHFKTASNQIISIRCSHEEYHKNIDHMLNMGECSNVSFPANLADILSRAAVMMDAEFTPSVTVKLTTGKLLLESRKTNGWYQEEKRIKYDGREIEFTVHPKFLKEMLERTRKAEISEDGGRMKITADNIQFLVALEVPADNA